MNNYNFILLVFVIFIIIRVYKKFNNKENYENKKNYLIINIIESDKEILERIKLKFSYDGKIYITPKNNGQTQVSIRICSNILKSNINEYINTNIKNKSLTSIDEAKDKCKTLGFKPGTEKFGTCVLELTK